MLFKRKKTASQDYQVYDEYEEDEALYEAQESIKEDDWAPQGNYRLDRPLEEDQAISYPSRRSLHAHDDNLQTPISMESLRTEDNDDWQGEDQDPGLPKKRAKYSAKVDRFLNSGIIIVGVLLLAVLLIAFLV
ncbi:hypothetical protein [Vaginisenegalia massiliensis]|uniref:hypothetical protein n=1 Tax=Vaginisenegalia massiliensis TaxID=2058294 RepID=UPI000F541A4D|nr:hypothetical protein [Vaginisenegalia massiliensis]